MVKVVIVGAGICGLVCAYHLIKANIKDLELIILEASDKLGGRLQSAKIGGREVDLGGAFVHGTEGHPVMNFLKEFNLSVSKIKRWGGVELYDASLSPNSHVDFKIADSIQASEFDYLLRIQRISRKRFPDKPMPLPEAFEYFDVEGEIEQLYNNLKRKNPKISREWVAKSFRSALTFTGNYNAAPLERLPAQWYEEVFHELQGGNHALSSTWGGFAQILGKWVDERNPILRKHAVRKVDYSAPSGKIVLYWNDGSKDAPLQKIECDYVCLSSSLGVLKREELLSFIPPLPKPTQTAIQNLGMGLANKIFLSFKQRFWNTDHAWFQFNADDDFPMWVNMWDEPILCCFVGYNFAMKMGSMSDEEIVQFTLKRMSQVFGEAVVKSNYLDQYVITRWQNEPFICGSYSFVDLNARTSDWDEIQKPFGVGKNQNVTLMGEATSAEYFGSVHSSMFSGEKEARRLIKKLK